ncbi:MAG TPA: GNAT family N-acetyltransferase [Acidisoma sp.]|uniref:GNAT family N-acetyltransferase n=1 Tax=Acidisoma sp. TaxID=1872115 RepID=UPI002CD44ED5|nr:GNAT family N-acetyltransferase [Acidisoma sp.]HTI02702.1 GNAT family N-acetyltransferase [Acidisoma sp.]
MADVTLRLAKPGDVPTILGFVKALAAFEQLTHEVVATDADFHDSLFGEPRRAEALIAEMDGTSVGFALWFYNFSTFRGRHGLYLEDIYIDPAHRGAGIGRQIFRFLAQHAISQGCARMDWDVLNWNEKAVRFYRSLGAIPLDGWTRQRLTGPALTALAES